MAGERRQDVVEKNDRGNRIGQIEKSRARGKEVLQPQFPARRRLSGPLVGASEVKRLRPRKNQEEVEEDRRQQKQRNRSGVLHEDVDPPIRGGPQPANEKQQEQDAQEKEQARGPIVGAAVKDEESDEEEKKSEDGKVKVGGPSEPLRGERHQSLPLLCGGTGVGGSGARPAANQVRNLFTDRVAAQLRRGI